MLTTYAISFVCVEDFNNFCSELDSLHFNYITHIENDGEFRFFIVVMHKYSFNYYKVQEFLKSYHYKYKSYNRSLSSLLN